jgi:hypothetical protein
MLRVARHDCNDPRAHDLCEPVDLHLELTCDQFVDLFLRVEMLVDG